MLFLSDKTLFFIPNLQSYAKITFKRSKKGLQKLKWRERFRLRNVDCGLRNVPRGTLDLTIYSVIICAKLKKRLSLQR
jgi:hypothetical protein